MDSSELDALSVDSILVELDQISDEEFCVNLCMEASITEPSLVQRFLDYAQHRVRNGRDSISRDLACKLQKTIKRFGTHQLLCLKDAAQALCWPVFRVADLAKQMSELLICGRMEEAIIIWQRHSTEEHFMVQFEMILSSVPRDVSFQQIYSFTRNEIISRVRQEQDM